VQEAFQPANPEESSDAVARGILQFPSLNTVHLEEGAISDLVLGTVLGHCPGLRRLSLTQEER